MCLEYTQNYFSPLGAMEMTFKDNFLVSLVFKDSCTQPQKNWAPILPSPGSAKPAVACTYQLNAYFSGNETDFDVAVLPSGTAFQKKVWSALQEIPFATTSSYLNLSNRIGDKKAVRAVGLANSKNPIAIIIPCHRIIGADGNLTGYAGGLWRKEWLLKHEAGISGKPVQLGIPFA